MNKSKFLILLLTFILVPAFLCAETIEGQATGQNNGQVNWVEVTPSGGLYNRAPVYPSEGYYSITTLRDALNCVFVTGLGVWSTDYPTTHVTSAGVGLIDYPDKAYSDNPLRYALTLESSAENAKAFSAPAGHIAIAMKSGTEIKLGNSLFCFNMGELKSNLIRAPRQQAADWSVIPKGLANVTPVLAFTAGTAQGRLSLSNDATFTIETRQQPASGQQAYLVYGDVVEGQLTVGGYKAMIQPRRADVNSYSCQLDSIYPCNLLVFAEAGTAGGEEEVDPEDVAEPDYSDIIALMKWDQIREGHDCFIGAATLPNLAWLAGFGLLFGLIRRR